MMQNPCCQTTCLTASKLEIENYRKLVAARLPHLKLLDYLPVTATEKGNFVRHSIVVTPSRGSKSSQASIVNTGKCHLANFLASPSLIQVITNTNTFQDQKTCPLVVASTLKVQKIWIGKNCLQMKKILSFQLPIRWSGNLEVRILNPVMKSPTHFVPFNTQANSP